MHTLDDCTSIANEKREIPYADHTMTGTATHPVLTNALQPIKADPENVGQLYRYTTRKDV